MMNNDLLMIADSQAPIAAILMLYEGGYFIRNCKTKNREYVHLH